MENQPETKSSSNSNSIWLGLALIFMVALAAFFIFRGNDEASEPTPQNNQNNSSQQSNTESEIKTFTVTGRPFSFSPEEIRVKKGERVKIIFVNEQGTHDWVIDEFNARTDIIQAGQTDEVEFVADKIGQFEYYCSVMNHRQMGMVGKLIVE